MSSLIINSGRLFGRQRCHSTAKRFLSSRRRSNSTPGQGGTSEEHYIANAIRKIRELNPNFVVEVINACHVGVAAKLFSASSIVRNPRVFLKVLTHADLLSDEALCYQMMQAQRQDNSNKNIAVMALDLQNADTMKPRTLRNVTTALVGGARLANSRTALVCGIPNAGKSSFILPLSKHRTLQVKKKKSYHLPKIAPRAGWTLSIKKHLVEVKGVGTVTLIDTPGLRPRINHVHGDIETKALLIATGAMEPTKGMIDEELEKIIVTVLLKALNRHGSLSSTTRVLPYVQTLGLDSWTEDPVEFLKAFQNSSSAKGVGLVLDLVRKCRLGHLGGMIFEEEQQTPVGDHGLVVNRNSPILCINADAKRLIDIGTGQEPLRKTLNTNEPV